MILFPDDWKKYPGAIIHESTRNRSALKLAYKLKSMGVQNYTFFLALHNPELADVDPYGPLLTVDQKIAIGLECKFNPWYFFRELARAPAMAGTSGTMVEFNRANISFWWSFFNHITYILTQPRQTGKSFAGDLLSTLLYGFYCNNTQINLLTATDKLRGETIVRLKAIQDELPLYLNLKTRDDANNTEMISVVQLGNSYHTHVAQSSEKRANLQGRGLSTPILHIDEGPFQTWIQSAFEAATGAMGAAISAAQRNGSPYGIVMTTTAGKKDDRDGRYFYNFAMDAAPWSERFYDALTPENLDRMVRQHSRSKSSLIYGVFSYKQLGKDDDWMRSQLERGRVSGDAANRDYFNVWTSGSQSSPLPTNLLNRLTDSIRDAETNQISAIGGYILRWYLEEKQIPAYMSTCKTVVGIDTSDAVGRDGISFEVTDVETGALMAAAEFNETNLITFAQWLVEFIVENPHATIVIERRSSGATIIDYLLMFLPARGVDPFKRLFNWVVNDPLEHKDRFAEVQLPLNRRPHDIYVRCKKYFGFATSGTGATARNELYSTTLRNAVERCADIVRDRSLVNQITNLETRNGRVDHPVGGHDDSVIAWLMTHWFLSKGKNLQFYGIDSRSVMVDNKPKADLSPQETFKEAEQNGIRMRIDELSELMKRETDDFITERFVRELRHLDSRLILKEGEFFSIDALLNEVKEANKKARYTNQGQYGRGVHERFGYYANAPVINGLSGGVMQHPTTYYR